MCFHCRSWFLSHIIDCNVNLHPNLAFDLGYLGDLTSKVFIRMVQVEYQCSLRRQPREFTSHILRLLSFKPFTGIYRQKHTGLTCLLTSSKWIRNQSVFFSLFPPLPPEGRPGMSDVSPLSGIWRLSFDSTLLSLPLFFCLVLLPFLCDLFLPTGPFF